MERPDTPAFSEPKVVKYSPLWYSLMCMKAFFAGERKLAEEYYDLGQQVLQRTGSVFLPLTRSTPCKEEETRRAIHRKTDAARSEGEER
jgi:hypothetical protein